MATYVEGCGEEAKRTPCSWASFCSSAKGSAVPLSTAGSLMAHDVVLSFLRSIPSPRHSHHGTPSSGDHNREFVPLPGGNVERTMMSGTHGG